MEAARPAAPAQRCTFKHFKSVNPPNFDGKGDATQLLVWFDEMENAFLNADCPEDLKTRHSTACLRDHALAWWNSEKLNRGSEEAYDLSWDDLKELMLEEYCPDNEVEKLEREFHSLKQNGGDNKAYTRRFHQLRKLVPHICTNEKRAVRLYITGLPMEIRGNVRSNQPATLKSASTLAAQLSEDAIRDGVFSKIGGKTSVDKAATPSSAATSSSGLSKFKKNKKRKSSDGKNFAVVDAPAAPTPPPPPPTMPVPYYNYAIPATPITAVAPPPKKQYTGSFPECATCKYHHPPTVPCRLCSSCGRYGHVANTCRRGNPAPTTHQTPQLPPMNQAPQAPTMPQMQHLGLPSTQTAFFQPIRACFNCGDTTHFRNNCPRLVNIINTQAQANPAAQNQNSRGRAFTITASQARASQEVITGTFLVNNKHASMLFDSGADRSFVSLDFEPLLDKKRTSLTKDISVEIASGRFVTLDSVILDCSLTLGEFKCLIDLIPMKLGSFDLIVGMDFMSRYRAKIDCYSKSIEFPLDDGRQLTIFGETTSKRSQVMSCTQTRKYLRKKYFAFVAHVTDPKSKAKKLEDIPVVKEFLDVFRTMLPAYLHIAS